MKSFLRTFFAHHIKYETAKLYNNCRLQKNVQHELYKTNPEESQKWKIIVRQHFYCVSTADKFKPEMTSKQQVKFIHQIYLNH